MIRGEGLGNEYFAETGKSHSLDFYINKDAGTRKVSEKMMATAVEAVLGAVHLDGGDDALASVMDRLRIVDPFKNLVMLNGHHSHLHLLQILCDLLTLTLIGLLREGSCVAVLRGCPTL